jgi:hypothetical protein
MDRRGTIETSAEEVARRLGLPDTAAAPFRRVVEAPIRWVSGGPINRELKHPLVHLKPIRSPWSHGLLSRVGAMSIPNAREREQRELQEQ